MCKKQFRSLARLSIFLSCCFSFSVSTFMFAFTPQQSGVLGSIGHIIMTNAAILGALVCLHIALCTGYLDNVTSLPQLLVRDDIP